MSKKIAVTEGSGKLGRACIDALLEEGRTPFNFDLVRADGRVLPGVEFRAEVPGTAALCSLDKAQRLLGWTPSHHWRDHADAP